MAKQGYPGLVLVPPSDRQIVKRRLARWTLLIVAVMSGLSALNVWLPSPDKTADCQPILDTGISPDPDRGCDRPIQSGTETQSVQNNLAVANVRQGTIQAESRNPIPTPPHAVDRLTTQPVTKRAPPPTPPAPVRQTVARTMSPPQDGSAPGRTTAQPASTLLSNVSSHPSSTPIPDTHLAERGDAFAQYRLGRYYAARGGPHTPESVSWYTKASAGLRHLAETGNGEAMYVLGVMYAFGRGVKQDTEEARRWLTRAVDHHVAAARPVLASLDKHRLAEGERTGHGG